MLPAMQIKPFAKKKKKRDSANINESIVYACMEVLISQVVVLLICNDLLKSKTCLSVLPKNTDFYGTILNTRID